MSPKDTGGLLRQVYLEEERAEDVRAVRGALALLQVDAADVIF